MPGMTFEHGLQFWQLILSFVTVLAWPVTVLMLALMFRSRIADLLGKIRRAVLPGGGSIEFSEEAAQLAVEANAPDPDKKERPVPAAPIPKKNLNVAQIDRGLQPTASGLDLNYFRRLAEQDPNLSLAALRMEIEIVIRNLAKGFGVAMDEAGGPGRNLTALHQQGALTDRQLGTARKVLELCNRAIHGQKLDATTALAVIDATGPLLEDYKAWLVWGFPKHGGE